MQLEIHSQLYTVDMEKVVGKKSKNLKCTRQSQKIICETVINMEIKSKDKLIRVGSCFSFFVFFVFRF